MSIFDKENTMDSRDIVDMVESFENEHAEALEAISNYPNETDLDKALFALIDADAYAQYKEAKRVCEECEGGDWKYGVTLIADGFFTQYAEDMCKDIGDIPTNVPSYIEIDWEATAKNIQQDYSSVDIGGMTYWYRS